MKKVQEIIIHLAAIEQITNNKLTKKLTAVQIIKLVITKLDSNYKRDKDFNLSLFLWYFEGDFDNHSLFFHYLNENKFPLYLNSHDLIILE